MANAAEQRLLEYVQRQIRTGTRSIDLPAELLENVGEATLQEMQALCKLTGVTIRRIRA